MHLKNKVSLKYGHSDRHFKVTTWWRCHMTMPKHGILARTLHGSTCVSHVTLVGGRCNSKITFLYQDRRLLLTRLVSSCHLLVWLQPCCSLLVLARIPWLDPDSGHELAFEKGLNSDFQQERKDGVGANRSIGGLKNVILWEPDVDPDLRKLC